MAEKRRATEFDAQAEYEAHKAQREAIRLGDEAKAKASKDKPKDDDKDDKKDDKTKSDG